MVTRTEVIQQRRSKDGVRESDIDLILDYYDTEASSTSAPARAAIQADLRARNFMHPRVLEGLYDYIATIGGTQATASFEAFEKAQEMQKDNGMSREMLERILDEIT